MEMSHEMRNAHKLIGIIQDIELPGQQLKAWYDDRGNFCFSMVGYPLEFKFQINEGVHLRIYMRTGGSWLRHSDVADDSTDIDLKDIVRNLIREFL